MNFFHYKYIILIEKLCWEFYHIYIYFCEFLKKSIHSIFVIITKLTKILYYKQIKIYINIISIIKLIIDLIIEYYNIDYFIISK